MHLLTVTPLHINRQPAKRIINLSELAEVLAAVPEVVRCRTPLDVLKPFLYTLAFKKPTLIEEVEAVIEHEENRRAQPLMRRA